MSRAAAAREFIDDGTEVHAVGSGFSMGFMGAYLGSREMLLGGALLGWDALRSERPPETEKQSLLNDIRREPQYYLGGFVTGIVAGLTARSQAAPSL